MLFFALLAASLGACRKGPDPAPDYDRLRAQLVQTVFADMAAGRSQEAVRGLARLQDAAPDQVFPTLARMQESRRATLLEVNRLLAAGDLAAARQALAAERLRNGADPTLDRAAALVEALHVVQAYHRLLPFYDSATASAALAPVEEARTALQSSAAFAVWLEYQHRSIGLLRQAERLRQARQITLEYDLAVVSGDSRADLLLAQLAELEPDNPAVRLRTLLLRGTPDEIRAAVREAVAAGPPVAVEAALCRDRARLPADLQDELYRRLPAAPGSFCGLLLRAELAAGAGAVGTAGALAERLCRAAPATAARLARVLTPAVLTPEQYGARPWRVVYPSITDLLNRVAQVREQQR